MAGDCVGNRNYSSNRNLSDAALTQSPIHPAKLGERKLVSGVGFTTIYCTDKVKIELSTNETWLRRTKFCDGKKEREILYERIVDRKKRRWVENLSENWRLYGAGHTSEYYVLRQLNSDNKPLGYCKIIKQDRAERGVFLGIIGKEIRAKSEDDWIYFARRGH